jgi:hypothetical protein
MREESDGSQEGTQFKAKSILPQHYDFSRSYSNPSSNQRPPLRYRPHRKLARS